MISKRDLLAVVDDVRFNGTSVSSMVDMPKSISDCNQLSWNITHFNGKQSLMPLASVGGMSTPAYAKIISSITQSMSADEVYVNIGCYMGFTLLAGLMGSCCRVIGVDNFSQFNGPRAEFMANYHPHARHNSQFHDMDYVEYMQNHAPDVIDFYFYDGPHKYADQHRAITLANHKLRSGSLILIDDTNVTHVKQATVDALQACGRSYDTWLDITTAHNKHPTYWNGLMLLQVL